MRFVAETIRSRLVDTIQQGRDEQRIVRFGPLMSRKDWRDEPFDLRCLYRRLFDQQLQLLQEFAGKQEVWLNDDALKSASVR